MRSNNDINEKTVIDSSNPRFQSKISLSRSITSLPDEARLRHNATFLLAFARLVEIRIIIYASHDQAKGTNLT